MNKPDFETTKTFKIYNAFLNHVNVKAWSKENKAYLDAYMPQVLDQDSVINWLNTVAELVKINIDWEVIMDEVNNVQQQNVAQKKKSITSPEIELAMTEFTDFFGMANKFIQVQPIMYDRALIWWMWSELECRWTRIDEIDLLNTLDNHIHSPASIKTFMKTQIIEALKRTGRKAIPKLPPKHWVQFKNTVVDVKTNERYPVSPDYFFTNPIPWTVGESEETPVLDKLFNEWVGPQYTQTLYEILAYCLVPDYPIQRIFCFVGGGMNGKTTFLKIVDKFIGRNNITSASLDMLISSRFESSKLYKKLVCFIGETNFEGMRKTDMLKNLSDGGMTTFEFKNKDHITENNTAKILVATNTLPTTEDKTIGFYRRWLIIKFPNMFSEKLDVMAMIPDEEFQNLALKSIRILNRLYETRGFTNEGTVTERQQMYEKASDPLQTFINEYVVNDPNGSIFKYEFADKFEIYCKEHKQRVISKQELGYKLSPLFESNTKTFYINGERKSYKIWQGITWCDKKSLNDLSNNQNVSSITKFTKRAPTLLAPLYKAPEITYGNLSNLSNTDKKLSNIQEEIIKEDFTHKPRLNEDMVYFKCKFCDAPESVAFAKNGAPICLYCIQNENLKNLWPDNKDLLLKSSFSK